jgi:hypothetical protein
MEKAMALHWLTLERRVLNKISRPSVGPADQTRMVDWTNEVLKEIATKTVVIKGRIIVGFIGGTVQLLEEDMPGTEEVGKPAYAYGLDGAFYIKYCIYIDRIREVERTAIDESEGGYMYDYLSCNPIYKERQEEFCQKPYSAAVPLYYGVYRYWVTVPRTPADPPRTRYEPYETKAIWFDPMFTNEADTPTRLFEVQYRRWGPAVDLTVLHDSDTGIDEYAQPYIYMPDEWDDLLVLKVARENLFAINDSRRNEIVADIVDMEREMKLNQATRGDLDYTWQFQPIDRIPRNTGYNLG